VEIMADWRMGDHIPHNRTDALRKIAQTLKTETGHFFIVRGG
jgi:hypothetical protein